MTTQTSDKPLTDIAFSSFALQPALLAGLAREAGERLIASELQPHRARLVADNLRAYPEPNRPVTIVADGTTLWLYDVDLNQVTARKQAQALGSTPAALIATAPNLKALEAEFSLQDAPEANGLQWVIATPKAKDGQLQSIRVGFKNAGEKGVTLAAMEILDSFGQRSVLSFSKVELNPAFGADVFNFKTPAGADVIRQ